MKVSVIVPYVNGTHFLEDCFESLKDQTYKEFEVILIQGRPSQYLDKDEYVKIVEDASNIVNRYREYFPIKTYSTKEVSTLGAARNIGIENAEGEYVYFLDADDYLLSDALEKLVDSIELQKVDIVYGKNKSTWFKRKVYLDSLIEEQSKNDNETDEKEAEEDNEDEIQGVIQDDEERKNGYVYNSAKGHKLNFRNQYFEKRGLETWNIGLIGKRRGLRNISALNILINRELLMKNNIRFQEDVYFYADLLFVAHLLNITKTSDYVKEAIYIKRKHNDPVHYPSISQLKSIDRFNHLICAYEKIQTVVPSDSEVKVLIDYKLINYYINYASTKLYRSEHAYWKEERFDKVRSLVMQMNPEIYKSAKGYNKKMIKLLLKGKVSASKRKVIVHLAIKKAKKIRKNRRVFATYLYNHFFLKMPLKENWVILESFFAKSYSDSPKYIYQYMNEKYPGKYRYIWVINDKKTKIPYKHTKVKRYSIRYAYYLARCKYDIFNVRQPMYVKKREGNVFIETWHGTPLKRLVFDQEEVCGASPLYKAQFYSQSRLWDYLISDNRFSTEAFKSAFLFDNEILETGYPRNDILYAPNKEELILSLKKKLGIPTDKKTILYAPTWRDDEYYGKGQYKFALKLNLNLLRQALGDEYVVLLRTHYFIADSLDTTGLEDFAFNLSKYDDISELYLISDILITDYSSVFFDYANLKRPILFYTYDLDKYRDMLRGFYLDIETEVPGPLLFTDEEVIDAIKNIDRIAEEYQEKYELFYNRFCHLDDGHASERIVERVFNQQK